MVGQKKTLNHFIPVRRKNPSALVETNSIRKLQFLHPNKPPVIKNYYYGLFPGCLLNLIPGRLQSWTGWVSSWE